MDDTSRAAGYRRRTMLRAARSPLLALILGCLPVAGFVAALELPRPPAAEARSGGSGGGFSRSSSGGSRSSGSSGGSRSSGSSGGYRSSSGGYRSSGGGGSINLSPGATFGLIGLALIIFVILFIVNAVKARVAALANRLSVARLQLGFDATRAKGLRDVIEAIVRKSDPNGTYGLWKLSRPILEQVELRLDAVAYASFAEQGKLAPAAGEGAFNAYTGEARAFFDREVVRKDAAGLHEAERNSKKANALTDEDGDFGIDELFVVTLVMAASRGAIGLPEKVGGLDDVKAAITAMRAVGVDRHTGFEVIWTPAAESDILGRDELLVAFPQLAPL